MRNQSSREARREPPQADGNGGGERRRRLQRIASAAIFLVAAVVAVLIVIDLNQSDGGDTNLEGVRSANAELRGVPQSELVLGNPKAKLILFEFGDLQCPVCKRFSETVIPDLIESRIRSGEMKFDFRNYPIIGEESTLAGAAAVAAGQQGRGFNFVDLFYRNQGPEASGYVTDEFLTAVAEAAGVKNIDKWGKERQSKTTLDVVERTNGEAERLGFDGTPSFAVVGPASPSGPEMIGTPESAEELEAAIEKAGGAASP